MSKMLSKGYTIAYKDHIIEKMPIKLITDKGFYYCKHCSKSLELIKGIGYGIESKIFNKMCFHCYSFYYDDFIKSFKPRAIVILELLLHEVGTSPSRCNSF